MAEAELREAGITDLSLDLIFGLPASLGRDWQGDLARAVALEPGHLSLYGLTVEEHTPLARWTAAGRVPVVDEELRFLGAITVDDVLDVLLKESWRRGRSRGFGG